MVRLAHSQRYIIGIASFFLVLALGLYIAYSSEQQKIAEAEKAKLFSVPMSSLGIVDRLLEQNGISDSPQKRFFLKLWPAIQTQNLALLKQRHQIKSWQTQASLSEAQQQALAQLVETYRVKAKSTDEQIEQLLRKVDIIPVSLVLSQAAIESAWGRSRFAKVGNNLFGVWCYSLGCGIAPLERAAGDTHEVKKYDSLNESISDYMLNLNRNRVYRKLVDGRVNARLQGKQPSGSEMAVGLTRYSALGDKYISMVRSVIRKYHLESLPSY